MLRVNWNYIKGLILLSLVAFLYAFSSQRNAAKKVSYFDVKFLGENNLFITHDSVNKLLIQNNETLVNVPKDILDLNSIENILRSNSMIKTAEVYFAENDGICADIIQRKPIARVHSKDSYYIDEVGDFMPLSNNYTSRVPLVTGVVDRNNLINVFNIAEEIYKDEFLRSHITEIHQDKNRLITLKIRVFDFDIIIGELKNLKEKVNNLKAFYQKAQKDRTLNIYSKVNLQFNNQVVCTKKENHG